MGVLKISAGTEEIKEPQRLKQLIRCYGRVSQSDF